MPARPLIEALDSLKLNFLNIRQGAELPRATRPIEVLQPIQALAQGRLDYLDSVLAYNRAVPAQTGDRSAALKGVKATRFRDPFQRDVSPVVRLHSLHAEDRFLVGLVSRSSDETVLPSDGFDESEMQR